MLEVIKLDYIGMIKLLKKLSLPNAYILMCLHNLHGITLATFLILHKINITKVPVAHLLQNLVFMNHASLPYY